MAHTVSEPVRLVILTAAMLYAARVWSIDAAAVEQLLKDNKCTKCHAIERKKDGPAYRDVSAKFRAKPDAEAALIHHLTSGEMVKFADGHEERHKKLKPDDPQTLQTVARWILSLEGGSAY
jgi:cytochrome c